MVSEDRQECNTWQGRRRAGQIRPVQEYIKRQARTLSKAPAPRLRKRSGEPELTDGALDKTLLTSEGFIASTIATSGDDGSVGLRSTGIITSSPFHS